jgi:hypothetical protein
MESFPSDLQETLGAQWRAVVAGTLRRTSMDVISDLIKDLFLYFCYPDELRRLAALAASRRQFRQTVRTR